MSELPNFMGIAGDQSVESRRASAAGRERETGPGAWLRRCCEKFDRLLSLDHKAARQASEEYDEAFHAAVHALRDLRRFADTLAPTWRESASRLAPERGGEGTNDTQRLDWWFARGLNDSVCEGSVDLWWADEQDGDSVERVTHGTSVRDALDKAMRGVYDA